MVNLRLSRFKPSPTVCVVVFRLLHHQTGDGLLAVGWWSVGLGSVLWVVEDLCTRWFVVDIVGFR